MDSSGERLRVGEIDARCVAAMPPKLTPQQAASHTWKPEPQTWAAIKRRSAKRAATVTITGFAEPRDSGAVSRGQSPFETSKDPVGAPIFYRDVPLMPSETEKGVIKPLPDQRHLPLIAWRLRNIGEPQQPVADAGMHTCANCHSFSRDGKTLGMDVDGPQNDKGLYALVPVQRQMSIRNEDVIRVELLRRRKLKTDGHCKRFGFMSQVSPDGQYVVTTIEGSRTPRRTRTADARLADSFYTANFKDYRFLQVFYPTRGILAWYSRAAGKLQPLPGADDPRYVHTNAVWSPDGKYLVFARAEAREPIRRAPRWPSTPTIPNETQIQYDLYRIPFNGGKGGQAGAHRGRLAERHEQQLSPRFRPTADGSSSCSAATAS